MRDPIAEISRDELIAYATERGEKVSTDQLVRWHRAGLLPRPRVVRLGRGKGTQSVYPIRAAEQAVEICRALRVRREQGFVAWWLWSEGYDVTPLARGYLLDVIAEIERPSRESLDSYSDEAEPEDERFTTLLDRSMLGRPWPELGPVRRRVGVARFPTFVKVGMEVLLGAFRVSRYASGDLRADLQTFVRGLSAWPGAERVTPELLETMARHASLPDVREAVAQAPTQELERARDELRIAMGFVEALTGNRVYLPPPLYLMWFHVRFGNRDSRAFIEDFLARPEWPQMKHELAERLAQVLKDHPAAKKGAN